MSDILCFVEDGGAGNFIAPLAASLARQGLALTAAVAGVAAQRVSFDPTVSVVEAGSSAEALLETHRPRAVVVGTAENPKTLGLALVSAAKAFGVPSIGIVDAYVNTAWRWRGTMHDPLFFQPDWLFVPDAATSQTYQTLGFPPARMLTIGYPMVDQIAERLSELEQRGRAAWRARLWPHAAPAQRIVVFVSEVSTGLHAQQFRHSAEYTLHGRGRSSSRTRIVVEEFLDALPAGRQRPFVVIRLHPKNKPGEFTAYRHEVDAVSYDEDAITVLYAADAVVGMTSTLLFEATLLGCPTLAILPRLSEQQWLPNTRSGHTACVFARHDLPGALSRLLHARRGIGHPWPGGSVARMKDHVLALLAHAHAK